MLCQYTIIVQHNDFHFVYTDNFEPPYWNTLCKAGTTLLLYLCTYALYQCHGFLKIKPPGVIFFRKYFFCEYILKRIGSQLIKYTLKT